MLKRMALLNSYARTSLYMLCDVLHVITKLQASLQAKNIVLASIPSMVDELKDKPQTSKTIGKSS